MPKAPRFDEIEGIPLPRGDDPAHGYGSRSIREFARQHGAQLDYDIRPDFFELRLLLPLDLGGCNAPTLENPAPGEKGRI